MPPPDPLISLEAFRLRASCAYCRRSLASDITRFVVDQAMAAPFCLCARCVPRYLDGLSNAHREAFDMLSEMLGNTPKGKRPKR